MTKKIRIGVVVAVVVTLFAVSTGPALAAWIGSLRGEVQIEEPIQVIQEITPPGSVYPGETFNFAGEITNSSQSSYGIRLYGFLWFVWLFEGIENVTEIALEELPVSGEVSVSVAAGPPIDLGTIEIYVNGFLYSPGSIINIGPNQTHEVLVVVTTSHAAPAGRLMAEVFATREAPVR